MINQKKFQYIQCNKQGYHFGQVINMVCTQKSCLQNLTCCCACIQQQHKTHITKPLRMLMKQAQIHSNKIKPIKINIDVLIDIINQNQKETLKTFRNYKKQIINNLQTIQNSLISYYSFLIEQVKIKSSDPKLQINKAFQIIEHPLNIGLFKDAVKKVVNMIPKQGIQIYQDLTQIQVIQSINLSNKEINSMIKKNIDQVNKKLIQYQTEIQNTINSQNLWKKNHLKFSNTLKHADVKLINDFTVKSQQVPGYKFAIMDKDIEKNNGINNLAFKVKLCTSNWVAIGLCHKNIIVNKSYMFNFSTVGHGAYLISANGGSWSNLKAQANNCVKAFKFNTNDIIMVTINFNTKKITFKKKLQTYQLDFATIQGDPLYPCVLFYHTNDEIQYLPNYQQ